MTELPEGTGDERIDTVLAGLARVGELPVNEHVGVFEEAFAGLEGTLASVEDQ